MPNHVDQRLTLVGPDDDVRAFVDLANGPLPRTGDAPDSLNYNENPGTSVLSFHAIVPLPPEYHTTPYSAGGLSGGGSERVSWRGGGYGMEQDTWGVKWGAYREEPPEVSEGRASYNFTCAWGPPMRWVEKASQRFPTLGFFLSYGGEGPTVGRAYVKNGEVLLYENLPYDPKDYPNEEDFLVDGELDDAAFCDAYDRAEHRLIHSHDAWVDSVRSEQ